MVLAVLYPAGKGKKPDVLDADVVAVHGLNGGMKRSWTHEETKKFWLQDFLPINVPNVRVMTFGYMAGAAFGNSTADITDYAKDLLSSLVDKREEDDELRRPIIFIGHSLGGIVIKQALFQATIEERYKSICKSTIGIIFLGTPHQGSEKIGYGGVLANVARAVMNKPPSSLIEALRVNSRELMRLTTDFRFQLSHYQVCSFYERIPTKILSGLAVGKHSALLDIELEDQIPVDTDHEGLAKFSGPEDVAYQKLFMRVLRMMEKAGESNKDSSNPVVSTAGFYNKHYCVPYHLSCFFTGREGIINQLRKGLLHSGAQKGFAKQRRFVIYGLGGSGKTQTCLKFAQDCRESFWGIFWINASSPGAAQQGFLEISQICRIQEDPRDVKTWLANIEDPWLLIIDNADDPSMDISKFFPTGDRGAILVTTRNPECRIHATVGSSELGEMSIIDATKLFLRTAGLNSDDKKGDVLATMLLVTEMGSLPLAVDQAAAYVQKGLCSVDEYCKKYARIHRKVMQNRSVQGSSGYGHSVYTTWEVSAEAIDKMSNETSRNAMELLGMLSFFHYEGIYEKIFEQAWRNRSRNARKGLDNLFYISCQKAESDWDPTEIRDAAHLLASYSLVKYHAADRHMSMHPLVHAWARDRLTEDLQRVAWAAASSTLSSANSGDYRRSTLFPQGSLTLHIDSCMSLCTKSSFPNESSPSEVEIAANFALVFEEASWYQKAVYLREKVSQAIRNVEGEHHINTLRAMNNLALTYSLLRLEEDMLAELEREKLMMWAIRLSDRQFRNGIFCFTDPESAQEIIEESEKQLETDQGTLCNASRHILTEKRNLAVCYREVGRTQEALTQLEHIAKIQQRTLGNEHSDTLITTYLLANCYMYLGQTQESMKLNAEVIAAQRVALGKEHLDIENPWQPPWDTLSWAKQSPLKWIEFFKRKEKQKGSLDTPPTPVSI